MARNLKGLGLALVAVVAMSAVVASAAQGVSTFKSSSPNGRTSITATNHESTIKFTVGEAAAECKVTHLEGTAPTNSQETITLTAKATECAFGGSAAEVNYHHCAYIFYAETKETTGDGKKHGRVDIECAAADPEKPTTNTIEVKAGGFCTMFIGAQSEIKDGIVYTNVETGGKKELTAHVTARQVKVAKKEGPFCFLVGNSGNVDGTVTVKGYEDTGTEDTGTAKTTPSTVKEGEQVNIEKMD